MRENTNQMEKRKNYLLQLKKEIECKLAEAPAGLLRICRHQNHAHYYHRANPKDFNGNYIRSENLSFVKQLAQKDYDQKLLRSVEKELNAIDKYLANYPKQNAEQVYENLHKERQKLITPIEETEEQYVAQWKAVEYCGKGFAEDDIELYTIRGERVRSKSEIMIADLLSQENIPYRYEYPLSIKNLGDIYPDFTLLHTGSRKEWFWEHLGMMDDPHYAEDAIRKLETYAENGIYPGDGLIITCETRKKPLNPKTVMQNIEHYFK